MPSVIQLKSGKTETVFDLEDLLRLVEQHMGDDTRRLLEELTAPEDDAAELIQEKEIDRKALSTVVGKIGTITWREVNVR